MTTKPEPGSFPWQYVPRPGRIYGASTVGERGQIALPAQARRELGIEPGDKVMVFGNKLNGSIVLIKADIFESFADFFTTKLNKLGASAQGFMDSFTAAAEGTDVPEDDALSDDAPDVPDAA